MVAFGVLSAMDTLSVDEKLVPLAGENVGVAAVGGVVPVTLWNQSNDAEIAGAFAGVLLLFPAMGPTAVTCRLSLKLTAVFQFAPSPDQYAAYVVPARCLRR